MNRALPYGKKRAENRKLVLSFSIAKFIYSQETIWDNSVLGIMLSATIWQK
jgi:hypothetical protein